jgi:hypothetical protein
MKVPLHNFVSRVINIRARWDHKLLGNTLIIFHFQSYLAGMSQSAELSLIPFARVITGLRYSSSDLMSWHIRSKQELWSHSSEPLLGNGCCVVACFAVVANGSICHIIVTNTGYVTTLTIQNFIRILRADHELKYADGERDSHGLFYICFIRKERRKEI